MYTGVYKWYVYVYVYVYIYVYVYVYVYVSKSVYWLSEVTPFVS